MWIVADDMAVVINISITGAKSHAESGQYSGKLVYSIYTRLASN
jgi:hypothetical protein